MIASVAGSSGSTSYGFENLVRSGAQSGGSARAAAKRDEKPDEKPGNELTAEERRQVDQLQSTDARVRRHEQAHLAVGRDLVKGGASYSYVTGPDNKRYAVAGEVSIDASPAGTPKETIPKAAHIRATALAPADPSAQDRSVAARADRMAAEARIELMAQQRTEAKGGGDSSSLYRSVQQSTAKGSGLGGSLDLYA